MEPKDDTNFIGEYIPDELVLTRYLYPKICIGGTNCISQGLKTKRMISFSNCTMRSTDTTTPSLFNLWNLPEWIGTKTRCNIG
jgi:hypothetical protein